MVGNDGETNKAMIVTDDHLYAVTDRAIYAVQMADQIDPDRTNINLPMTVQQKGLGYGSDSEFVARTFMTAAQLFNPTYLGQTFPVTEGKLLGLELAKRLATLQDFYNALAANEERAEVELQTARRQGSFKLPETPDLRTRVETFAAAADRIQETLFKIAFLFYPKPAKQEGTRAYLIAAVEAATPGRTNYHDGIKSIVELLHRIREHRNASVHEDGPKALIVRDFHLLPDGDVSAPLMTIQHPVFASPETPVTAYMSQWIGALTAASEAMIAWLCGENITLKVGPFEHHLDMMPDGQTVDGSRYYYRTAIVGPLPTAVAPLHEA